MMAVLLVERNAARHISQSQHCGPETASSSPVLIGQEVLSSSERKERREERRGACPAEGLQRNKLNENC